MSMWAVCRLRVTVIVARQRYVSIVLAAAILPVVTVPVGASTRDSYALSSFLVPLLTAPLAIATAGAGSRAVRSVTAVAAGGLHRVIIAEAVLAAGAALALGLALAVLDPTLAGSHVAAQLGLAGFCCIGGAALSGAAVGVITSHHVLRGAGTRMVGCVVLLILVGLAPGISPVAQSQRVLTGPGTSLVHAALVLTCGSLWLAGAVVVTAGVASPRGLV